MTTAMRFDFDHAVTDDHDIEIIYSVTAEVWPGAPAITTGHPDDQMPADGPEVEILKVHDIVDVEIPSGDWPGLGLCLDDLSDAAIVAWEDYR